jgi:hypothetical protein
VIGTSLVTLLLGSATGLIKCYMDNQAKLRSEQQQLLAKDTIQNRESTNKFYQFTRRLIALILILSIVLYPLVSALLNIPFYLPYTDSNGFISSLFMGDSSVLFKEVPKGLIMPNFLIQAGLYVIAFYFSAPTKRS